MAIRFLTLHVERRGDAEEFLEELKRAHGVYEAILKGADSRSARYFMKVDESMINELKQQYGEESVQLLTQLGTQA